MKIVIKPFSEQEMLDAVYSLGMYAFHPSPPLGDKEEWLARVRIRGHHGAVCSAAYEGETPVAVAISSVMTQNMRGALYPASGVWGVSTHPAARRKGCCRQAIAGLLAAERETGKVFSNLYPFRESFYERLGYVSYPYTKIARLLPSNLAPLLKLEPQGEIELKMIGEAYETYRQYLSELRLQRHGMAIFNYGDQTSANRNLHWVAFARFDGQIEGVMLYALQGEEVTKFNLVASRFYYQTSRARYLLLNWIARHIDQAEQAELWLPGDEAPETWLADIQVKIDSPSRAAMSRVLDVEKIGGMTVGEGSFSAQIIDPFCPWNEGPWRFESRGGKLQVSKTTQAGCDLTIQGLSALVAGTHAPEDLPLRGWGNPDAAAQSALRSMFPRLSPLMHELF